MVFEEVLLNSIQLACQPTYFYRHVNKIEFMKTFSDSDRQHNDEIQGVSSGLYIFDSMLKIFITLSNREQSICDNMRKILSTMTKISMISLVCLCVCFCCKWRWKPETLIYRGLWTLWTTEIVGALWSIQKNPMLKEFGLCNPNFTYTL